MKITAVTPTAVTESPMPALKEFLKYALRTFNFRCVYMTIDGSEIVTLKLRWLGLKPPKKETS